jgi:hypothetical protein
VVLDGIAPLEDEVKLLIEPDTQDEVEVELVLRQSL